MVADGKIVIETGVDSSGLEKGVNKISSIAKGGFKMFTGAVVGAGTALIAMGASSVKLASDLQEVQNVVDVTFGSNAGKINDWAKNASNAFGLSELQAKAFDGTLGAMMKSMGLSSGQVLTMSENMVGLSGDFASFYNLKPEEAFEKIRAGISGETEPLKQLGINMSVANLEAYALTQGIKKQYKEMNQAEQATLRYNYLMSVSKDAQGDFARTSDSLANQLRIVKLNAQDLGSTIGTALIPSAKDATKEINNIVGDLKKAFSSGGIEGLASGIGSAFARIVTDIAQQAPKVISTGVTIIQAFITGIQNNLPQIAQGALQIIQTLANGFITLLPQILQLGFQLIIQLAQGLIQALPNMIPSIIQLIVQFSNIIIQNLPTIIQLGLQLLLALAQGIANNLPTLIIEVPKIINGFADAFNSQLPMILKTGIQILVTLGMGIIQAIPTLIANLPQVIMAIVNAITLFNWASLGKGLIAKIGEGISSMKGNIGGIASGVGQWVETSIGNIFRGGFSWGRGLISSIGEGISGMGSYLSSTASSIGRWAMEGIRSAFSSASSLGSSLVEGIWSGITNMGSWIINKIGGFAGSVISGFKKAFDINSPSKKMRDIIGKGIVEGISVGIDIKTPDLKKDVNKNMSGLISSMKATVDLETAKTTASVVAQNNYSIQQANPNMDNSNSLKKTVIELHSHVDVDGREVAYAIAPHQEILEEYDDGR